MAEQDGSPYANTFSFPVLPMLMLRSARSRPFWIVRGCLSWDQRHGGGGMNHFMLPLWNGEGWQPQIWHHRHGTFAGAGAGYRRP